MTTWNYTALTTAHSYKAVPALPLSPRPQNPAVPSLRNLARREKLSPSLLAPADATAIGKIYSRDSSSVSKASPPLPSFPRVLSNTCAQVVHWKQKITLFRNTLRSSQPQPGEPAGLLDSAPTPPASAGPQIL